MKGLIFIATFLLGLGVGTTVAWLLLRDMISKVRAKASHAMQCLVEQQTENLTLQSAVNASLLERQDFTTKIAELQRKLKIVKQEHTLPTPRVRVVAEEPPEPTRCRPRAPARKRAR